MATQRPAVSTPEGDFAGLLLAEREVAPRAEVIAQQAAALLEGCAINVYVYNEDESPAWPVKGRVGEATVEESYEAATLTRLAETREPLLFSGTSLAREHYAHLDVRRTIASLAYVPILLDEVLIGAIEAISFDRVLDENDIETLDELTELSALALATGLAYENERNSNLDSITRLTQLYDVEKVFNSTLQMSELMPIICAKVRELLNTQAVNLYMVGDADLVLMARDGEDETVELESGPEAIVKQVGDTGEPVVITDAADARLAARNGDLEEGKIVGLMAAPVVHEDSLVAVLECVNKTDGTEFDEDDLFFLTMMTQTAAGALHNASLMEAEKKIEILETLVEVSNEITSTLNLERVLQVVVNAPQKIMTYDRASVALESKGKLQLKAVSGMTEVVQGDPKIRLLRETLEFASQYDKPLHVVAHGDTVEADREETRQKFFNYFKETGVRGWYSALLMDDQGKLGVLCFESTDPDFLSEVHFEFINVVASQATVALRNASLYEEVPLIGLLEPIIQKKKQFMAMEKKRRGAYAALAAATILFLIFVPLPMRVSGESTVAPQSSATIQAEVPGVVHKVYVHEGDRIAKGTILADLDDWDYRAELAAAQAKRETALAAMNRALAANDGTEAGIQQVQAEYWTAESNRGRERLERTRLRSPIDGVVATPHIDTLGGTKLAAGDTLAKVVNTSHATVDVAVDETDVPLLEAGEKATVKLDGFPLRRFVGRVDLISPMSTAVEDKRVYFARVDIPNPEGIIRPGMSGISKLSVGWKPAGYVMFRGFGMWLWAKLWAWFGW
ncbi:MAG: efflux RND transporter periplasmic adaptor subunit [Acidobacteriia bacterium]|nr:efflux RND transporter periplasmic adaptor subunit [Terriglobia bacterium]